MGLDPMEIVMIRQAVEKGLAKPDELKLVGDPVPGSLTPFKKPDSISLDFAGNVPGFLRKPFVFVVSRLLKSYPQVNPKLCVGCGKCAESCPAGIIRIENKKAKFRKKAASPASAARKCARKRRFMCEKRCKKGKMSGFTC